MDAYKKKWMHTKRNGCIQKEMDPYKKEWFINDGGVCFSHSFSYQYEQSLKEKESLTTHLTQCQREYDQALDDSKTENSKVKLLF